MIGRGNNVITWLHETTKSGFFFEVTIITGNKFYWLSSNCLRRETIPKTELKTIKLFLCFSSLSFCLPAWTTVCYCILINMFPDMATIIAFLNCVWNLRTAHTTLQVGLDDFSILQRRPRDKSIRRNISRNILGECLILLSRKLQLFWITSIYELTKNARIACNVHISSCILHDR